MDIVILFMFGIASEFPPAMSKHLPVFFFKKRLRIFYGRAMYKERNILIDENDKILCTITSHILRIGEYPASQLNKTAPSH